MDEKLWSLIILKLKYKSLTLIGNVDINKIVVSNKVFFGKNDFKYFIGYKYAKKIDLYAYFFHKLVLIEEILMRLNVCLFDKRWKIVRKK